ncbi:hypothetical protein [Kitasatospora sp. NPDC086791]|uniref:hypothetical protein n=1 Tax=Kitasatospora sp. NPDC086791 TaxID=3155178 RepID=UPI003421C199
MAIIVLEEPRRVMSEDFGPGRPEPRMGVIHAAPADPSIPGDPTDQTFCGKDTGGMEKMPYSASRPGASWYPQNLSQWVCPRCAAALRSA